MENKKESKDKLDKISQVVEIINKVFIGIILVLITSIFTWRSNFISDTIKEAEFKVKQTEYEQKLLADFMFNDTSESKFMRQDIGLAILYDFLVKDTSRRNFLLDIALIVAQDTSRLMHTSTSNLALEILYRLDGTMARKIQYLYSKSQESNKNKNQLVADLEDTIHLPDADTVKFANFRKYNRLAGRETVFIQISDASLNDKAEQIRQTLLNLKYLVPTIQVVKGNYKNSIRYFNAQDYTTMKEVKEAIKIPDIEPLDLTNSKKLRSPTGSVEIWISSLP